MTTALSYPEFKNLKIVLASASPRRLDILQRMGFLDICVVPSTFKENLVKEAFPNASDYAIATAVAKGSEVTKRVTSGDLVIAADTVVCLDSNILEKPHSIAEARLMLSRLAKVDRPSEIPIHSVITGVALFKGGFESPLATFATITQVRLGQLNKVDIEEYVNAGESLDKAGGYGVQGLGAHLIESIHGCFYNVQGLPFFDLSRCIAQLLKENQIHNN